jgi:hypothetical protein
MKKQESKAIYLLVLLIVMVGILSFLFRAKLADTFLKYDYGETSTPVTVNKKDELNLDLLRDEKIKALKNNFSIFNYDDLSATQEALAEEFRSSGSLRDRIITNEDGSQTIVKSVFFRVDVGNDSPFAAEKEIK